MKWLREPLWVFIALGLVLFWLDARSARDDLEINVTEADVGRLTAQWQAQTGRDPTAEELDGLVDQFVEEEVYYREALNYDLQRNDTIIRRRLVQKLTFLTEDIATSVNPEAEELEAYYQENRDDYRVPQKYSFQHVYFSRDRREDAQADAQAEHDRISATDTAPKGDPFMLQSNFAERSVREVASTFGRGFAQSLEKLPVNAWSKPVPSAYGHHLVYLHSISEPYTPQYPAVADRVATDHGTSLRKQANEQFKKTLLEKYRINKP